MITTSREFAYWLQGFFEISGATTMTEAQVAVLKQNLNSVFKHEIDPSMGDAEHQAKLRRAHEGGERRDDIRVMC